MWLFSIEFTSLPAKNRKYTSNLKWEIKGDCFIFIFVQATLLSKDIVMLKMYFGDLNHALAWKARRAVGPMQYIFSLIWLKDYPSYSYGKSSAHISIFSASKMQLCAKSLSPVVGVPHRSQHKPICIKINSEQAAISCAHFDYFISCCGKWESQQAMQFPGNVMLSLSQWSREKV